MTRLDPRRRRTPEPPAPAPEQGAVTVTTVKPRSQQFIEKVKRELREADTAAKKAHEEGQAAFAEAYRHEQADAQFDQEQQKLRAEWDRVQMARDEAQHKAKEARARGERAHAARDAHADEVADAQKTLELFGYDPNLMVPVAGPEGNGQVPADPTADTRTDEALARIDAARAELPAKHREEESAL